MGDCWLCYSLLHDDHYSIGRLEKGRCACGDILEGLAFKPGVKVFHVIIYQIYLKFPHTPYSIDTIDSL